MTKNKVPEPGESSYGRFIPFSPGVQLEDLPSKKEVDEANQIVSIAMHNSQNSYIRVVQNNNDVTFIKAPPVRGAGAKAYIGNAFSPSTQRLYMYQPDEEIRETFAQKRRERNPISRIYRGIKRFLGIC